MPLSRRVKGACRAAAVRERKTWEEEESSKKVQDPDNEDEMREMVESMEIQEAKSTIQRLARKYLHKAQTSGKQTSGAVDIVRVEEDADSLYVCDQQRSELRGVEKEMERSDVFDFRDSQQYQNKENRAKRERGRAKRERGSTKSKMTAKTRPKRTYFREIPPHGESGDLKVRLQTTPVKRMPKTKPSVISPEFKIPKPTLGHSTPSTADRGAIRRQSLFGFETLESPLTLSPVAATPFLQESPVKSPEDKITRSSSYNRLVGTYDIPIHKPTPRRQQARRKTAKSSSAVEAWAKKLNTEFAEVDQFELAVE